MKIEKTINETNFELGEDHFSLSAITPLLENAFDKSDAQKIDIIQDHVKTILETLGMDLKDDSLKRNTPASCQNVCQRSFWRTKSGFKT